MPVSLACASVSSWPRVHSKRSSPRPARVASEMWTRPVAPISSICIAPAMPLPHMSKWNLTVPMMPPISSPVWTPMREPTSRPHARLLAATASTMCSPSAAIVASCVSHGESAPAHTTYASPMVLTLSAPKRSASSSKASKSSDKKSTTCCGVYSDESRVKPTRSHCSTLAHSYRETVRTEPAAMSCTIGTGSVLSSRLCVRSRTRVCR